MAYADFVYLTDEYDHELEVDLALMDEGIYVGVWCQGPYAGVEVDLTSAQVKEARKLGEVRGLYG